MSLRDKSRAEVIRNSGRVMLLVWMMALVLSMLALSVTSDTVKAQQAPSGLDAQLLDDLEPAPVPPAIPPETKPDEVPSEPAGEDIGTRANPLESIARQMRTVEQRMQAADTSQATQTIQQHIVDDLQRLIAQLEQQQAGERDTAPRKRSGTRSRDGMQQANSSAQQAQSVPGAAASTQNLPGQEGDPLREVWGHLPERVRERVANQSIDQFLPKYERLIEAYYRRLAEEDSASY